MAKVSKIEDREGWPALQFFCPGCRGRHTLRLRSPGVPEPTWSWNGNPDAPTIYPAFRSDCCHGTVKDGRLRFLSSSMHRLAAREVEMEEVRALS